MTANVGRGLLAHPLTRRGLLVGVVAFMTATLGALPNAATSSSVFVSSDLIIVDGALLTAYSNAVLSDNPRQYLPMSEPAGSTDAWDLSGKSAWWGHPVNDAQGTIAFGAAPLVNGSTGSIVFNGGRLRTAGIMDFYPQVAGDKITIEFWMYLPSTAHTVDHASLWSMANAGLVVSSSGIGFTTYNTDFRWVPRTGINDRPVHVVAVMTQHDSAASFQAGQKLYLNGVLQTNWTQNGTPGIGPMQDMWNEAALSGWFNGWRLTGDVRISDFAAYKGELPAARVTAHYAARVGG